MVNNSIVVNAANAMSIVKGVVGFTSYPAPAMYPIGMSINWLSINPTAFILPLSLRGVRSACSVLRPADIPLLVTVIADTAIRKV